MAITRSTPAAAVSDYATNDPSLSGVVIPTSALCVVFITATDALSATLVGTANAAITDSGSHTWTLRAFGYDHDSTNSYPSAVWVYEWFNNTGADVTTTITTNFSALAYNPGVAVVAQILAGARDPSTYTPQVVTTTTQSLPQASIVPSYAGSQIIAGFVDKGGTGTVTAVSGSVIDTTPAAQVYNSTVGIAAGAIARSSTESTIGTAVTIGGSAPTDASNLYTCVAVEYYDASATPANFSISGNRTVPVAGSTTLTASSTSNSTSKTYSWSVTSGVGGTLSSTNTATTIFNPSSVGNTVVSCQITDPNEIGTVSATIASIENHYRVHVNGSWANPNHFIRQGGVWAAGVHYGKSGTGNGGVASVANDGRTYTQTVLADNPSVYYAMQEVGGTAAIDWSGHGYHGTYKGGVTLDYAANPYLYPPVALGRATLADNSTTNAQYVSVPGSAIDVTNGLSFEIWINSNGWNFNNTIFYLSNDASDGTDVTFYHAQNAQNFVLTIDNTSLTVPGPSPDTGSWHHLAVTIPAGGGTASVYADGALAGTGAVGTLTVETRTDVSIGRSTPTGASYYNGLWTQAAFYNIELSAARIQAHYTAGIADADPVWHGPAEWYDPSWYRTYTNTGLLTQSTYVAVADWMTSGGSETDIAAESPYFDISINPAGTDYSWFRQAGMSTLPASVNSQITGTSGSETIGYFTQDETDMNGPTGLTDLQQAAAAIPAGYLGYANFGTLVAMGLGSAAVTPQQFMNTTGINLSSADLYWYATTAAGTPETQYWQLTPDQIRRACNYGAVIERERSFQATPHPLWSFVELAHPNNSNTYGGPNPNQVEGAVWGSIIGGARGIIWFHHSFAQTDSNGNIVDPQTWNAATQYNIDDCVVYNGTYYYAALQPTIGEVPDPTSYTWVRWSSNSGAGISNADVRHPDLQTKITQIKADLQTMAPAINSPTMPHLCHKSIYSTYRPWATDGKQYIFAMPGLAAPNGGTFTMYLPAGQTPNTIEVVGESRTITPSSSMFTDTFNAEYSHHIYRW